MSCNGRGQRGLARVVCGLSAFSVRCLGFPHLSGGALTGLVLVLLSAAARADGAASAVFVRTDTDRTLVVSPRVQLSKRLDATAFNATYAADVWTSASIDIRTSASKAVTEQRDELNLGVEHEASHVILNGSYRYSVENDYVSHGGAVGVAWNFAGNNATFALDLRGFKDVVGKAGVPQMAEDLTTLGGRVSLTQVLTQTLLVQGTYEMSRLLGYQESPYRFIGIAGSGLGCEAAAVCLPERVPDERWRHALAALARQALTDDLSLGVNYRLFWDDWDMTSHTVAAHVAWMSGRTTLWRLRYRFYVQSGVGFYQRVYDALPGPNDYMTRDRELSPMNNHRLGLEIEQRIALDRKDTMFILSTSAGAIRYMYDDFVGLDQATALELTVAAAVEL